MERKSIRVGDWVNDPSNYNYELKAGVNEIQCAGLFNPITLKERYLAIFRCDILDGEKIYYKNEGANVVTLRLVGDNWEINIHSEKSVLKSEIKYVHELQHFLSDCGIGWEI